VGILHTGRSAELGFVTNDSVEWDDYLQAAFPEMPQVKVSKVKHFCLSAGIRWSCDYFTLLALFMILVGYDVADEV